MKLVAALTLCAAAIAVATPAAAQFQKPEDAVKYRQAAFTLMGNHMGRIGAVVKGAPYDAKAVQASTNVLAAVSALPHAGFAANTEALQTKAKPEIWKEQDKFKAANDKMVSEVAKLDAAAKTGNLDAIKAAFGDVGA